MTLDEYQTISQRTAGSEAHTTGEQLLNCALGLAGEAGEVADLIKKAAFHGHELDGRQAALELGDLLFYVQWTARLLGFDLSEIAEMNVEKLKRRYPDGFSVEASKSREE